MRLIGSVRPSDQSKQDYTMVTGTALVRAGSESQSELLNVTISLKIWVRAWARKSCNAWTPDGCQKVISAGIAMPGIR